MIYSVKRFSKIKRKKVGQKIVSFYQGYLTIVRRHLKQRVQFDEIF